VNFFFKYIANRLYSKVTDFSIPHTTLQICSSPILHLDGIDLSNKQTKIPAGGEGQLQQ